MHLDHLLDTLFGFKETIYETYDLTKSVNDLDGDLVECGIAAASQLAAMHLASPHKKVWGFDSFEGIQLAGRNDEYQPGFGPKLDPNRELPSNLLVSSGVTVCGYEYVEGNLRKWNVDRSKFHLIKGWVQNTMEVPENLPERISVLRLDMDMHDPTVVAMDKLWERLVPGGVLIIDDWGYSGVRKAVDDHFDKVGYEPTWQNPQHAGYLIK
jgi:O-methyltransferase